MGWLPLYATSQDFEEVFDSLNKDREVAFIVPNGPKSWMAKETAEFQDHSWFCLWHVPSGPLPLQREIGTAPGIIKDPWSGWTEVRTGGRPDRPYFGDPPGIIWLEVSCASKRIEGGIAMSGFSWIGNHYRLTGSAAQPTTEKYWNRLCRQLKKDARRIPRQGALDGPKPEIWALKDALQQIHSGRPRDINP